MRWVFLYSVLPHGISSICVVPCDKVYTKFMVIPPGDSNPVWFEATAQPSSLEHREANNYIGICTAKTEGDPNGQTHGCVFPSKKCY